MMYRVGGIMVEWEGWNIGIEVWVLVVVNIKTR